MTQTIENIVVPLDGSRLADRALPLAKSIADRAGAAVQLVRVLPEPVDSAETSAVMESLQHTAEDFGVEAVPIVKIGAPADQILSVAGSMAGSLVVMTTHGRSGAGRWLIGSVANRVVRGGEAPVLLLRSTMPSLDQPVEIRRIMIPLDGSTYGEAALPIAESLAELFDAELQVVRVAETGHLTATFDTTLFPVPSDFMTQLARDLIVSASTYLNETSQQIQSRGLKAHSVNLQGFPAEQLLEQERNAAIDLVVMATHARRGLSRMVFGNVAEQLLQLGQRPVLMVHPPVET